MSKGDDVRMSLVIMKKEEEEEARHNILCRNTSDAEYIKRERFKEGEGNWNLSFAFCRTESHVHEPFIT